MQASVVSFKSLLILVAVISLTADRPVWGQSPPSVDAVRRDPEAISIINQMVSALCPSGSCASSSLRIRGSVHAGQSSNAPGAGSTERSFVSEYLAVPEGYEFRHQYASNSHTQTAQSGDAPSAELDARSRFVNSRYRRLLNQPDLVPVLTLVRALSDPKMTVRFDGQGSENGSRVVFISTSTASVGLGQTTVLRHWTVDATSYFPRESTICAPLPRIRCGVAHIAHYSDFQTFNGMLSPTSVLIDLAPGHSLAYRISDIDVTVQFTTDQFGVKTHDANN